jgi:hypothetical protein
VVERRVEAAQHALGVVGVQRCMCSAIARSRRSSRRAARPVRTWLWLRGVFTQASEQPGDAFWRESPDMELLEAVGGVVVASENGDSGRPNFTCLGQVAIGNQRDAELLPGIEEHLVQRVVGRAQLVSQNIDRHAVEDRRDEHKSLAS